MFSITGNAIKSSRFWEPVVDTVILASILVFLLFKLHPHVLFSPTITTGGDTPSHYLAFDYLMHHLLPKGHISGWSQGNYAGFPILQNYFPLPFLAMAVLSCIFPLTVAFKIGTVLGILLLPAGAYIGLRGMRLPFPIPSLGALSVLSFLFMEANSMWGGNIPSTLAGEFAYSLSLALTLAWVGTLYEGIASAKRLLLNSTLLVLIALSHGCCLFFAGAISLFFLLDRQHFEQNFIYLAQMHLLAILLMSFWLVPFLAGTPWTTPFFISWNFSSWKEILPKILWPCAGLAPFAFFGRPRKPALYLLFGGFCAGYLYWISPKLGAADVRFIPFAQVILCLLAALGLGGLSRKIKGSGIVALMVLVASFVWVGKNSHYISSWVDWNYGGFESKRMWQAFSQINGALQDSPQAPRVVYENATRHNTFGTMRAFECLPVFARRSTLEHAYLQASPSSPFVFYLQSEISKEASCPFPEYGCTSMNYRNAETHLRLFNVREIIVLTAEAKHQLQQAASYRRSAAFGEYEIWELTGPHHYVEPLSIEPVLWTGGRWKSTAYSWFRSPPLNDIPLVFPIGARPGMDNRFPLASSDLSRLPRRAIEPAAQTIISEDISDDEIFFQTTQIHRPHLIKVSYDPHWRVEGADRIYLVSPAFMLVYPFQENVRLYYARLPSDYAGLALSLLGLAGAAFLWARTRTSAPFLFSRAASPSFRIAKLLGGTLTLTFLAAVAWQVQRESPGLLLNKGIRCRDQGKLDPAEKYFRRVLAQGTQSGHEETAQYFLAIIKYLKHEWAASIQEFERLNQTYPGNRYRPESYYHMALCYQRLGRPEHVRKTVAALWQEYPQTNWAHIAWNNWKDSLGISVPPSVREAPSGGHR